MVSPVIKHHYECTSLHLQVASKLITAVSRTPSFALEEGRKAVTGRITGLERVQVNMKQLYCVLTGRNGDNRTYRYYIRTYRYYIRTYRYYIRTYR